ncbi:MFS transporter [Pseudonocardia humida]|uniref:MFS transporter n=1 Tax=Pseudonocardia humida TaxID=2800819 RepID=A0ABT0ZYG1_9PSEU|nr:MFS transporter [Pseudonocardia humida]MCO1655777.1 MFS transporter [Pseudonocardia humida]
MALSAGVRRGYALGSVATGTFGTVPGLLLLPYLTDDLGVAAGVAGVLVLVPKGWDVVLNPIAGRISDRSGVRRPFLLYAGVAVAVTFALMFAGPQAPPALAGGYVALLFLACATAYAFFQVPYNAMPAEMTTDVDERTRMMTWRVAVLAVAILLSGATAPLVVEAFGYPAMGAYVGVLLLLGTVGAYLGTRGVPPAGRVAASGSLATQLRLVGANANFRHLLVAFIIQALAIGSILAGVTYVAGHLITEPAAATILFAAFVGPALLVTPLWERVALRHGKRAGYLVSSAVLALGSLTLLSTASGSAPAAYVGAGITGIGYAGTQVFPLAMLPDVAGEDARLSGVNRIGVFTGVWTAAETLGLALGPGLYALILQLGGYLPSTAGVEVTQPASALTAIAVGVSVVPAVLVAASLFWLRRYALDEHPAQERSTDGG